jgi:hypothetical protein
MIEPRPVSAMLEAELREQARQHGVIVWLDKEGTYTGLADRLRDRGVTEAFPIPVRCLRGSYLELMLALEDLEDGVGMTALVVHAPGLNQDSIAETPLFELYRAGRRYQRALPTLVREAALGRATPEAIEAFLAGPDVSLDRADAWLAGIQSAQSGGGPDLGALGPDALFEALLPGGSLAAELDQSGVASAVWSRAGAVLGVRQGWEASWGGSSAEAHAGSALERASTIADSLAGWALCTEFVHDLRRAPKDEWLLQLGVLPRPAIAACQKLASHLRARHPERYRGVADEYERGLVEEVKHATADDLGKIDTFRFEDRTVLAAALEALATGQFAAAEGLASERTTPESFWPQLVRGRQIAWSLVRLAAQLGRAIDFTQVLGGARNLADAVAWYAATGHAVDGAHRLLEQARSQLPHLEIEEVGALRDRLDQLRRIYRDWADREAVAFNQLCRSDGFVPGPALQQRTLFDEVVAPAVTDEPTAYFMVDALRFEMGAQLAESLTERLGKTSTAEIVVKARLAELPTVTEVGMNLLAPVVRSDKLAIELREDKIIGFRAGTARIDSPRTRLRAMHERVGGATCPYVSLEDLLERGAVSLRQTIARARLVVIHAEGIDKAGEKGVGLAVFERELQNLRAAYRLLYEAGIQRFVITADHGFLLHDDLTRVPRAHGKQTDPQRRHVIASQRRDQTGEVTVSSADLGYEGAPFFVAFPDDTAPFDRGDRAKDFVHGGNSLQERVIPVITVRHRHAAGGATVTYVIEARGGTTIAGMHRVHARVTPAAQTSLSYGGSTECELVLEAAEGDVQIELCDAPDARIAGGSVFATVGRAFELLFRLSGDVEGRVPVRLRHATRSVAVAPTTTEERFQVVLRTRVVTQAAPAPPKPPSAPEAATAPAWLATLPDGVREVFQQLADHGQINEQEATRLLGGARQFRNFSLHLDDYRARAPFAVRVDVSSGTKCYVRGDP